MKKTTLRFACFILALILYACSADAIEDEVQPKTKEITTEPKAAMIYTGNGDSGADVPGDK